MPAGLSFYLCVISLISTCRDLGIGFVPYSPLNRGFLGGAINEYTVFDRNNDNRHTLPRFQPEAMRANTRIVNVLQDFGRPRGMTSAQVALGWLLQRAPWWATVTMPSSSGRWGGEGSGI